jgi:hypothetical protein
VDEQCVNNSLPIGKKMGPWTPGNNCNNFTDNIFKKCKPCAPKNEPFPTPFGPCAKLADGTTVCAGTGI